MTPTRMETTMNTKTETDAVTARLDALSAQITWLIEKQRRQEELIAEMTPIAREALATAATRLEALEQRGWFAFARELAGWFAHADDVKPVGLMGVIRASRQPDVQKGMAVMLDLLRHVGHAARHMGEQKPDGNERKLLPAAPPKDAKAGLIAALAPRRARKAIAAEPEPEPAAARRLLPARPAVVPALAALDSSAWNHTVAEKIAAEEGVPLSADHWKVIETARADFEANQAAANIRRLTQITGMSTKDLYTLFPRAPGRTIARIAGTPKPSGCI